MACMLCVGRSSCYAGLFFFQITRGSCHARFFCFALFNASDTGQVALLEWRPVAAASEPECTTLHVVTFDAHTRFVKLRAPVHVRSDYRFTARLGDWVGHAPAYLDLASSICDGNTCLQRFLDLFSQDVVEVRQALQDTYEVVVASPGGMAKYV